MLSNVKSTTIIFLNCGKDLFDASTYISSQSTYNSMIEEDYILSQTKLWIPLNASVSQNNIEKKQFSQNKFLFLAVYFSNFHLSFLLLHYLREFLLQENRNYYISNNTII